MANILVVEDDKNLNRGVTFSLKKVGHDAVSAYTLSEAENILQVSKIDLILLDIGLPDGSGLELCKAYNNQTKIVFFTANDTEADMINGFEVGCDDYIPKPFSIDILNYKVNAILKRNKKVNENIFEYLDMQIDYNKHFVMVENKVLNLTPTEYRLLELLSLNRNNVLTKEILLEKLWDISGNFVDENTLSVNIGRLRKKVEKDPKNPKYIVTVFGIGYTFGEQYGS